MLDKIIKALFIKTKTIKEQKIIQVRRSECVYFDAEKINKREKENDIKVATSLSTYFKNNKGLNLTERGYCVNLDHLHIQ